MSIVPAGTQWSKKKLIIKHRHLVFPNPSYGLDLSACSCRQLARPGKVNAYTINSFSDLKAYLNLFSISDSLFIHRRAAHSRKIRLCLFKVATETTILEGLVKLVKMFAAEYSSI